MTTIHTPPTGDSLCPLCGGSGAPCGMRVGLGVNELICSCPDCHHEWAVPQPRTLPEWRADEVDVA